MKETWALTWRIAAASPWKRWARYLNLTRASASGRWGPRPHRMRDQSGIDLAEPPNR
jgi:hypothetical protein